MAEVTRRRNGEFLRKLFEILQRHPDGMQAGEAVAAVEAAVPLTNWEKGTFESGGRRFDKILRWASVDCVKAGWLVKNKGLWSITDEGRKAYADIPDPEAFSKRALDLYHLWKKSQPKAEAPSEEAEVGVESKVSVTFEEAEEQAWSEIESHLTTMPPYEFQELVASLLRAMGYHVAWIAPPGKDGGIDILAWSDPLGTKPPRIKVQVKRQQSKVAVDGLRSFMAMLHDDDVGLFVSTGGFTREAEDEARTQQNRKVTLVNLDRLFELWVEYYKRLDDVGAQRLPLRPIHFLAPEI